MNEKENLNILCILIDLMISILSTIYMFVCFVHILTYKISTWSFMKLNRFPYKNYYNSDIFILKFCLEIFHRICCSKLLLYVINFKYY